MAGHSRKIRITRVIECERGRGKYADDYLAVEEPLEMRAGPRSLGVTLRTPGDDRELVAGFLFTEGIVSRREQMGAMRTAGRRTAAGTRLQVTLSRGARLPARNTARRFSAGSACGACGKASLERLRLRGIRRLSAGPRFDPDMLCRLPGSLGAQQAAFRRTGGLHAAALFDAAGELQALREDVGRHNAVDKVIGWALLEGRLPLRDHGLWVSGRAGFEIVQKAAAAGIPLLASVSAPSSLAVQLARELGLSLLGFLRGSRFVIYSGEERIAVSSLGHP